MTVEVATLEHEHRSGDPALCIQFEDMDQQNDAYIVGMWTFLVTEIMFFGALFLAYIIYRYKYPAVYVDAHHALNVTMGAVNTCVLLTSSFSMALAVWAAQTRRRKVEIGCLLITMGLALTFLVVKYFEWSEKFKAHHFPGPDFVWTGKVPAAKAQMFFGLYFAMTGLHALHVIIGFFVMLALLILLLRRHRAVDYYMPVEMTGLYWHFVDIVWIFLFPLFYLIPGR